MVVFATHASSIRSRRGRGNELDGRLHHGGVIGCTQMASVVASGGGDTKGSRSSGGCRRAKGSVVVEGVASSTKHGSNIRLAAIEVRGVVGCGTEGKQVHVVASCVREFCVYAVCMLYICIYVCVCLCVRMCMSVCACLCKCACVGKQAAHNVCILLGQ